MHKISVNGQEMSVEFGTTVAVLLALLGYGDKRVAVERNQEVVPRAEHASALLCGGDELEIVSFVGGG